MHGGFVLIVTVFYKKNMRFCYSDYRFNKWNCKQKNLFLFKKKYFPSKKIVFQKTRKRKKLSIEKNNITFFKKVFNCQKNE